MLWEFLHVFHWCMERQEGVLSFLILLTSVKTLMSCHVPLIGELESMMEIVSKLFALSW